MLQVESLFEFEASPFLRRLWTRRRSTAVIELAALAEVLPSIISPSDELALFLANYRFARQLDGQAFAHVLGSPYGLVWLRRVFEYISILKGETPLDVAKPHMCAHQSFDDYGRELLDQLGVTVAAVLMHTGQTAALPHAVPLRRPTTLPSTKCHLVPRVPGASLLLGVAKGVPERSNTDLIDLGGIEIGGRQIVIDPYDDFLALESREGASREIGQRHAAVFVDSLNSALELFRSGCPEVISQIAISYYVLVPSLIGTPTGFPSGTTSTSLGLSAFSVPASPAILCEMLVHELSHAQLFAFQDIEPILDPAKHGEGWWPEDLYSPWRDDARPANGLLHAVYVFSRVSSMWLNFIRSNTADIELARRRLAALRYQLRIGMGILQKSTTLTKRGQAFWKNLGASVDLIQVACSELNLDNVQPQYAEVASLGRSTGTALQRQREHWLQWRQRNPAYSVDAERLVQTALAS